MKKLVAGVKGAAKRAAVGVVVAGASVAAFAQTSSSSTVVVDVSSTVSVISGVVSAVTAIGAAVLSVVVVAWGYKTVRGFIGR
ncbi:hypothetical protein FAZ69_22365 [Trinickia terrae]|uniref:Methyltransferase n=2 Tax=Trinickia terrae TaxID=2571161 RepID=A0A4U1HRD5_9BURK|nr:hypothetical protein FAZ69_22365 [Trinickia terrae]